MGRKRMTLTKDENVRKWGTGKLNIEECRFRGRRPTNVILSHGEECQQHCLPGCPIGDLQLQGVAHYYYQARRRRRESKHPTHRPIELMRYLCKLITPRGDVILDPFMGSASTGVAALQEGFTFVGVEKFPEWFEIANRRLLSALDE